MKDRRGTVQLYTGDGKGKTTAAIGLAMRAAGHNWRIVVVQFMKGRLYGELASAKHVPGLEIEQYGRDEFVDPDDPAEIDRELAARGWERVEALVREGTIDMLVLDEINVACSFGLVPVEKVVALAADRPPSMELVLTGRYAPEELIGIADTVTEMREIKHHYAAGVQAREGIEY